MLAEFRGETRYNNRMLIVKNYNDNFLKFLGRDTVAAKSVLRGSDRNSQKEPIANLHKTNGKRDLLLQSVGGNGNTRKCEDEGGDCHWSTTAKHIARYVAVLLVITQPAYYIHSHSDIRLCFIRHLDNSSTVVIKDWVKYYSTQASTAVLAVLIILFRFHCFGNVQNATPNIFLKLFLELRS